MIPAVPPLPTPTPDAPETPTASASASPTASLSPRDMAAMLHVALLIVGIVLILVVGTMCYVVIRDGSNPLVAQSMDELKQTVIACWACLAAMFGVHGLLAKVFAGGGAGNA